MQTVKNILFQYFFDGMHTFYCAQLLETAEGKKMKWSVEKYCCYWWFLKFILNFIII